MVERWRQKRHGEERKKAAPLVVVSAEFFPDKVPMDLRRRRKNKSKERKIYKRKGEKKDL